MSITSTIRAEWDNLSERVQAHIRRTRPALLRQWELIEEGHAYDTIMAETGAKALEEAEDRVERGNYPDAEGTLWIDVRVRNAVTGETLESSVTCEPDEPECSQEDGHDWQSPHSLLGGIRENPGVWGHGGGVIIRECCAHCGRYKEMDTWASNGAVQGLTSVKYEKADERSREWVASLTESEEA